MRTLLGGFQTYLCLVLAPPALKGVGLEVGYGYEPTEVTEMDPVGVRSVVETLVKELSRAVSDLAVTFHLPEPQTPVTAKAVIQVTPRPHPQATPPLTVISPPWAAW